MSKIKHVANKETTQHCRHHASSVRVQQPVLFPLTAAHLVSDTPAVTSAAARSLFAQQRQVVAVHGASLGVVDHLQVSLGADDHSPVRKYRPTNNVWLSMSLTNYFCFDLLRMVTKIQLILRYLLNLPSSCVKTWHSIGKPGCSTHTHKKKTAPRSVYNSCI